MNNDFFTFSVKLLSFMNLAFVCLFFSIQLTLWKEVTTVTPGLTQFKWRGQLSF